MRRFAVTVVSGVVVGQIASVDTVAQLSRNPCPPPTEYRLGMSPDTENIRLRAQDTLDELFTASLIPFALSACRVDSIGSAEYIVRFYDSRLHSIDISWKKTESFSDVFRASVLDRVKRLGIPSY